MPSRKVCIMIAQRPNKRGFVASLSALCFTALSRTLCCKSQHLKTAPGEQAPCCLICNRIKVTISQIHLPNQTFSLPLLLFSFQLKHSLILFVALKRNQTSQRCLVGLDVWSHHKLIKNAWLSFQLWLLVNCFSICHHLREFESWYLHDFSLYGVYMSLHEHRCTCHRCLQFLRCANHQQVYQEKEGHKYFDALMTCNSF